MARFGVPAPAGFLTNVVVVLIGKANALAAMQLLHHALKSATAGASSTPLAVDDTDPRAPAYFFDVTLPELTVPATAGRAVRASVFGIKGMASPHLAALLSMAHAVVVLSDGDDPAPAVRTLAGRVRDEVRGEVYGARATTSADMRGALLAVLEDVVAKATTPP